MGTVSHTITKILVHSLKQPKTAVSVSPSINISNIQIVPWIADQQVIEVMFKTGFTYAPDHAIIEIEGVHHYSLPFAQMQALKTEMEQTNKLPDQLAEKILSIIFTKNQTLSIMLAKEAGLPSPVPLPKLQIERKKAEQPPHLNKIDA
jgi:hypothetical protein